jgi:hypothetical protein
MGNRVRHSREVTLADLRCGACASPAQPVRVRHVTSCLRDGRRVPRLRAGMDAARFIDETGRR